MDIPESVFLTPKEKCLVQALKAMHQPGVRFPQPEDCRAKAKELEDGSLHISLPPTDAKSWLPWPLHMLAKTPIGRCRLTFGRERWALEQEGFKRGDFKVVQEGSSSDLRAARLVMTDFNEGEPLSVVELHWAEKMCQFGGTLSVPEQLWLMQQVNDAIAGLQGRQPDLESLPEPKMPVTYTEWDDY